MFNLWLNIAEDVFKVRDQGQGHQIDQVHVSGGGIRFDGVESRITCLIESPNVRAH